MAMKPTDKDTIRKIWLAGIGAYGRAFTEAKGAVDSLTGKGSEVFDELVQKGEMVEAAGKYKANELVGKGKSAVDDITPDFDIDDRILKMRARLSGSKEKSVGDLAARVDQLEAQLEAILDKIGVVEATSKPKKAPVIKSKAAASKAKSPKPSSKKKMTTQRTPKAKVASKKATPKSKTRTLKKVTTKKTASKTTTTKKT